MRLQQFLSSWKRKNLEELNVQVSTVPADSMTRDETIGTALESPKLKIAVKNMALLVPHNIPLSNPYGFKLKEYPKNREIISPDKNIPTPVKA